ncbi:hypothetical protein L0F63_002105, partial [Massospora cicadina]
MKDKLACHVDLRGNISQTNQPSGTLVPIASMTLSERIAYVPHHQPSKSKRVFDLPSAPIFYPTEEEFKDPITYISSIRSQAEGFGICKVVPPPSFTPTFALNIEDFTFTSRKQRLNAIGAPIRANLNYFENLRAYHAQNGYKLARPPTCGGRILDLYKLQDQVSARGGFQAVTKDKKWAEVSRSLGYDTLAGPTISTNIRNAYEKLVKPFEEYINRTPGPKATKRKRRNLDRGYDSDDCGICLTSKSYETLLLCEVCGVGFHPHCVAPPLEAIPDDPWYCGPCLRAREVEPGFEEGGTHTLPEFSALADQFRARHLAGVMARSDKKLQLPPESLPAEELENLIEAEFWRLVGDPFNDVTVEYGADLSCQHLGSGFPTSERNPTDPVARHPWNLTNLPTLPASMLAHLRAPISGMTVPWLYVGMCFTNFCWHAEDHYTYSINYQHWGDTKTWYGIPAASASAFEVAFRREVPTLFERHPDLLFDLAITLPPTTLVRHRVDVYALDQRQGEFVITFPRAYHAGFNHGLNCNEAANFAPASWLPQGLECITQYRRYRRLPAFCHHELLMRAATETQDVGLATSLVAPLQEMLRWGDDLRGKVMHFTSHLVSRPHPAESDGRSRDIPQCFICREFCYLLSITCHCQGHAGQTVCLEHAPDLCDCALSERILVEHVPPAEINSAIARAIHLSNPGAEWALRYAAILREEQRPCLSQLCALVAEVDALPFEPSEEAAQLAKFTKACVAWRDLVELVLQAYNSKLPDDLARLPPPTQLAAHIQTLLEYGQALPVQFEGVELFVTLGYWVHSFCISARILLSDPAATLDYANELQNQGAQLGLIFEETEQLDQLVGQLQWCEDARTLIAKGAAAPQPATEPMMEWLAALRTHLPYHSLPQAPSPTYSLPQPITPQPTRLPVEDGLIATAQYLIDLTHSQSYLNRPPTSKLYPILDRIQIANYVEPPFQELFQASVEVDHWIKQSCDLLAYRGAAYPASLAAHLANTLEQVRQHASSRGYFGCICFGLSDSLLTLACQVCSVIYHAQCVQISPDTSIYTCPICTLEYHPFRPGRPRSGDLYLLIQSGRNLPFIPPELNLMVEISKSCKALSSQSIALVQDPHTKLDMLKDQLRLLEGLDIALEEESHALHRCIIYSYPSQPTLPPASSLLKMTRGSAKKLPLAPVSSGNQPITCMPQQPRFLPQAHCQPSHVSHRRPKRLYNSRSSYLAYTQPLQSHSSYQPYDTMASHPHQEPLKPPVQTDNSNPFSIEKLIGSDTKELASKPRPVNSSEASPASNPFLSRCWPASHIGSTVDNYMMQAYPHQAAPQVAKPSTCQAAIGLALRLPTLKLRWPLIQAHHLYPTPHVMVATLLIHLSL